MIKIQSRRRTHFPAQTQRQISPFLPARFRLPHLLFLIPGCLFLAPSLRLRAATSAGQYGSDVSQDQDVSDQSDNGDPQYHGAKSVVEQESRQKDLVKWIKDVEMIKQSRSATTPDKKPAQAQSELKTMPRAQGYLNRTQGAPAQSTELFQQQMDTQADIDEELAFQKQALDGIEQEIKKARGVAKAGNSITHRGDGAEFMFYHGLLMGARGQTYRNGMDLSTTVNTFNITYDFSRRLMVDFTKVSTDPRGNVSVEQRSGITYTDDSSGLPGHLQKVTGYYDANTDPGGITRVTHRYNGAYNDTGNPAFNDIHYGGGMITSYDEDQYFAADAGNPAYTTTVHFRNGTYDAYANPLTYTQTTISPMGAVYVVQRLNSIYQPNPNYVDQSMQRVIDFNSSRPQFFLTGYDQYMADYVMINGSPYYVDIPVEIQHYTDVTYDNEDRLINSFMVATEPDNNQVLSATRHTVTSFDQWGNPVTWTDVNTNFAGILSVTYELATEYDQMNHPIYEAQLTEDDMGMITNTTQELFYNSQGLLIGQNTQSDSISSDDNLALLDAGLFALAGPGFPYGANMTFSGGF